MFRHEKSQNETLTVLTLATHCGEFFPAFLESCRRQDIHPIILGWGKIWEGFSMKTNMVLEHVQKIASDVILVTDAFDAFFAANSQTIISRFRNFEYPMVMATQLGCWPDPDREQEYPESPTPYRTINAGGYIADRRYFIDLVKRIGPPRSIYDDQRYWTHHYLQDTSIFTRDTKQEIFGTCGDANCRFVPGKGIQNRLTGSFPAHFHGQGDANTNQLRDWLGLTFKAPERGFIGDERAPLVYR